MIVAETPCSIVPGIVAITDSVVDPDRLIDLDIPTHGI